MPPHHEKCIDSTLEYKVDVVTTVELSVQSTLIVQGNFFLAFSHRQILNNTHSKHGSHVYLLSFSVWRNPRVVSLQRWMCLSTLAHSVLLIGYKRTMKVMMRHFSETRCCFLRASISKEMFSSAFTFYFVDQKHQHLLWRVSDAKGIFFLSTGAHLKLIKKPSQSG